MQLIIINFHHIDDESKYKRGIYPVSPERFSDQLDEIGKNFKFISEADLLFAIENKASLPDLSCLITLDDGLRNQYENALPVLLKKQIPAVFYINSFFYIDGKVCQAHKIHYLLSKISQDIFLDKILFYYKKLTNNELNLDKINTQDISVENRYDNNKDSLIKFLLNNYINTELSIEITDSIFTNYCDNELKYCEELYLDKNQIIEINSHKLFSIGLHTHAHININKYSEDKVSNEIIKNYNFLNDKLQINDISGISYPFGYINKNDVEEKVVPSAKLLGIKYGLTMNRDINCNLDQPLLLNRFDTNDVPGGKNSYFIIKNGKIIYER